MKQPENYDENNPEELTKKKSDAAQLISAVLRSLINNPRVLGGRTTGANGITNNSEPTGTLVDTGLNGATEDAVDTRPADTTADTGNTGPIETSAGTGPIGSADATADTGNTGLINIIKVIGDIELIGAMAVTHDAGHKEITADTDNAEPIVTAKLTGDTESKGVTGSTCSARPTGESLLGYGYIYFLAPAVFTVNPGSDIPFTNEGPLLSLTHPTPSIVNIKVTGDYLIKYAVFLNFAATASIALTINGIVNSATQISTVIPTGTLSSEAIITLNAGDIVTLRNTGVKPIRLIISPSIGSQLNLVKLTCR